MADLKTNYKDDVLDTSKNEKRKFRMIQNDDGTVSFDDATEYTQQGDAFGAADINTTNAKINEQNQSLTQLNSGSNFKYIEAYKTFVNLKNGESESVKINIDTPGVYLLNFSVCHCGGSSITSNDPSWSVKAPFNFFLARKTLAIPIAKRWDDISGTATFIKYLDKGEYTFNFINETGTSTSDTYYSTVFVSGIMVK